MINQLRHVAFAVSVILLLLPATSLEDGAEPEAPCEPRHVHLSLGRDQNATHVSMTVSFGFLPRCIRSLSKGHDREIVGAVQHSYDSREWTDVAFVPTEDVQYYNASLTKLQKRKTGMSTYHSDYYFHAELSGLRPSTKVFYRCVLVVPEDERAANATQASYLRPSEPLSTLQLESQIKAKSARQFFLSPPSAGQWYDPPLDRSIRFAVIGDLATRPHSRKTISHFDQDRKEVNSRGRHRHYGRGIDLLLLAGDLSYANGDHVLWDDWFDMMSEFSFFREIPTSIALGNHDCDHGILGEEASDDGALEIALAFETRFRMPQAKPAQRDLAPNELFVAGSMGSYFQAKDFLPYEFGNAYYSYVFGPSKHIVISSYSSFLPGSTQYEWLVRELEGTDRSVTPWLIVMLHCPPYTTFKVHHDEVFITEARKHLEPLFAMRTVNFVLSGHLHSYMRTAPTVDSRPNPRGPVYIIQGNGGRQANEPYLSEEPEEFVSVRDHSMYGYGTLDLLNNTHAKWTWVITGWNKPDEAGLKGIFEPDLDVHDEVFVHNQLYIETAADAVNVDEGTS